MQAIVLRELGEPEVLRLQEADDPVPGPGEALVRLRAAALNHRDAWIRKGQYAGIRLPVIPGSDGAGEVAALGEGGDPALAGQRVVINPGMGWGDDPRVQGPGFRILGLPDDGTYAQLIRVPAVYLHAISPRLSWEAAAALPLAGLTAYRAVVTQGRARAGERVLVTGIGGGVAGFAALIARHLGARVFVTSGAEEKLARARELGAEGGASYREDGWVKRLREATEGGPDLIVDSVGGPQFDQLVDLARPGGRVVLYGATAGAVPELQLRRVFFKQLAIQGSTMGTAAEFAAMLALFDTGGLDPLVDRVFPLAEAAAAHRRMEDARQFGKIVLAIP